MFMPRSFLPHFFFQVSSIFIDNYRLSMYYMRFGCSCPIFVLAFASIFGLSRDFLINWDQRPLLVLRIYWIFFFFWQSLSGLTF